MAWLFVQQVDCAYCNGYVGEHDDTNEITMNLAKILVNLSQSDISSLDFLRFLRSSSSPFYDLFSTIKVCVQARYSEKKRIAKIFDTYEVSTIDDFHKSSLPTITSIKICLSEDIIKWCDYPNKYDFFGWTNCTFSKKIEIINKLKLTGVKSIKIYYNVKIIQDRCYNIDLNTLISSKFMKQHELIKIEHQI